MERWAANTEKFCPSVNLSDVCVPLSRQSGSSQHNRLLSLDLRHFATRSLKNWWRSTLEVAVNGPDSMQAWYDLLRTTNLFDQNMAPVLPWVGAVTIASAKCRLYFGRRYVFQGIKWHQTIYEVLVGIAMMQLYCLYRFSFPGTKISIFFNSI